MNESPEPQIKVWLTENELAGQFITALEKRSLDEKFFYWLPLSVRAWLDLCDDGDYRNYVRSKSLIARHAEEMAGLIPGPPAVVSVGSGQGDKDIIILEALWAQGKVPAYAPLDSSQALLEMACMTALAAGFSVSAVKADFTERNHLNRMMTLHRNRACLLMMLGNTLGCLDPVSASVELSELLDRQDMLLVDGEIYSDQTLAGYDNPVNRRFAWGPLNSVGISDADGELIFEERPDPRMDGLYVVSKHFRARRDFTGLIAGRGFDFQAGESLKMSHSYKYSQEAFDRIVARTGMNIRWRATSDDGRFVMLLAGYPDST